MSDLDLLKDTLTLIGIYFETGWQENKWWLDFTKPSQSDEVIYFTDDAGTILWFDNEGKYIK